MGTVQEIVSSVAKGRLSLQWVLTLTATGLAFHVAAVGIGRGSPIARPELLVQCAQNPAVVIGAFAIIVSAIALGAIASVVFWWVWWGLPIHQSQQRGREFYENWVPLGDARRQALRERDTLWIERTEKERAEQARSIWNKELVERRLFACLLLLVWDAYSSESAFAAILAQTLGLQDVSSPRWVLGFVLGAAWCYLVLWEEETFGWIEHPALAAKLESERRGSAMAAQTSRLAPTPAHLEGRGTSVTP